MIIEPGLILAIALALVHGFANQLPIFNLIPRFRWTSFAGGVSLSYVFLEIFPELSHAQEELQHSEIFFINYLENHVYILALGGLLIFQGLNVIEAKLESRRESYTTRINNYNSLFFWLDLGVFAILNLIMSYLLQDLGQHGIVTCILFFITFALHFFIIDDNLREHQRSLYDRIGRWLLVAAIILGTFIGQVADLNQAAVNIVWSFLAGTIILNVLKRELPDEHQTCFGSFFGGSILFSILLLSI